MATQVNNEDDEYFLDEDHHADNNKSKSKKTRNDRNYNKEAINVATHHQRVVDFNRRFNSDNAEESSEESSVSSEGGGWANAVGKIPTVDDITASEKEAIKQMTSDFGIEYCGVKPLESYEGDTDDIKKKFRMIDQYESNNNEETSRTTKTSQIVPLKYGVKGQFSVLNESIICNYCWDPIKGNAGDLAKHAGRCTMRASGDDKNRYPFCEEKYDELDLKISTTKHKAMYREKYNGISDGYSWRI
eukprot:scaffold249323_cov36-Cyclotella_meneghiniana.AAC.5